MFKFKVLSFVLCFSFIAGFLHSEEFKPDLNKLTTELQKISNNSSSMEMIWWIPNIFWITSMKQKPGVTDAQVKTIINVFKPYTLVAIVDGDISNFGGVTYKAENFVRANTKIIDQSGNEYSPITNEKLGTDVKSFLSIVKPILVNALGPMGQNMHFILFPGKNKKNEEFTNVYKKGTFSIKYSNKVSKWELPLSSVVAPIKCSKCLKNGAGVWEFCPWCGTKYNK